MNFYAVRCDDSISKEVFATATVAEKGFVIPDNYINKSPGDIWAELHLVVETSWGISYSIIKLSTLCSWGPNIDFTDKAAEETLRKSGRNNADVTYEIAIELPSKKVAQ